MTIMLTLLLVAMMIILIMIVTSMKAKRKFITVKVTHWLLIIYIGVLLLSMSFVHLITNNSINSREKVENWDEDQGWSKFFAAMHKGKLDLLDSNQLINEKIYNYENPLLNMKITGSDDQIYVERKDQDDGKIEARVYTNGLYISGYDFTDKIVPVNFQLMGETLNVLYPGLQTIDISVAGSEFTINQFTGQNRMNGINSRGQLAVYLKIPKSLQLNGDPNVNIQYVKE